MGDGGKWVTNVGSPRSLGTYSFLPYAAYMDGVSFVRWTAPTSRGGPALPANPTCASSGLTLPRCQERSCFSVAGKQRAAIASASRWGGRASACRARGGDVTAGGLSWARLLCLSYVPAQSPTLSATLREITKVVEVSGSQEDWESWIGAQRSASIQSLERSASRNWDAEIWFCKAILTPMLFLGQLCI